MGRIKTFLVGHPLSTEQLQHERIPKWKALAVLSSDALSSVAYATEEVLIPLSLFATAAVAWSLPIAVAIACLLIIITISYRQTIDAYPGGGGAYTVAKENLGVNAGLVAGGALLIDYVLTVAVSTAAGVENVAAAFPMLLPHKEILGILVISLITLLNLRGVRESASIFALPTYIFIFSFIILIGAGAYQILTGNFHAVAPIIHESYPAIPIFLLLRAFSSGCSALTGIEAISNGIPVFETPTQKNAKATMLWMSSILGGLFLGITLLAHAYGIVPKEGETAVSLLSAAVFGKNGFYFVIQIATALILMLAANTSYADFPRLSSLLAKDKFLPRQLSSLGDRLVFSNGIIGLSLAAIFLLILFKGDTHHLLPLYAVGVFLSFTLSQSGMIKHHLKNKQAGWKKSIAFNAVGATATLLVLLVISSTKFLAGAWMVVLLIPVIVLIFKKIHSHYTLTANQLLIAAKSNPRPVKAVKHTAIVPVSGIHPGVLDAVRYAISISQDPRACYVELNAEYTDQLQKEWAVAVPGVPLVVLKSPFRSVIKPIIDYIDEVENERDDDVITVIIPEFVARRWYHNFLHNQTAIVLFAALRGKKGIIVTSVRHHL
ncbi:MAG: APC family permease [Oligoflexus sp.]|nr:APC family permease [Oligoflexus sp.]